jgi:hypothetical protein
MTMSKGTKRVRVLVVAGLAVIAGALGVGLSLASSGSQTGILTGELRLVEGGPAGETVIVGPGTVVVAGPVGAGHRLCNLCQERGVAKQRVSRDGDFRFALPTGSYDVSAFVPSNAYAQCGPSVRVSVLSGRTLLTNVTCVSTVG